MRRIALSGMALALALGPATQLAGSEAKVVQEVRVEVGQKAPELNGLTQLGEATAPTS